jgi:hypothetical protein
MGCVYGNDAKDILHAARFATSLKRKRRAALRLRFRLVLELSALSIVSAVANSNSREIGWTFLGVNNR